MRLELVGSRFSNRTVPVALVSSTRLPVAGKVSSTATGTVTSLAGTTAPVASGAVAVVSATTMIWIGPTGSGLGVTAMVAEGSSR